MPSRSCCCGAGGSTDECQLATADSDLDWLPGRVCSLDQGVKMDELRTVIRDYVVKEYLEEGDDRQIREDTPLITGGIVDSFSMVSLKRFLERRYGIQIPDAEATPGAFDTLNSIAALVSKFAKTTG